LELGILRKYFDKRKRDMFPDIKDWTDPRNDIRLNDNVRAMSYNDWFWFHPSAFSLIHFGYPILSFIVFVIIGLCTLGIPFLPVIPFLLSAYFLYDLYKKIKTRNHYNLMTMHDVYLREDVYLNVVENENKH